jgi:hypothetical protein
LTHNILFTKFIIEYFFEATGIDSEALNCLSEIMEAKIVMMGEREGVHGAGKEII